MRTPSSGELLEGVNQILTSQITTAIASHFQNKKSLLGYHQLSILTRASREFKITLGKAMRSRRLVVDRQFSK
jgi:hypothetical protein